MAKQKKLFSDLYTVEEFLDYYNGATKAELRATLKSLGKNHLDKRKKNQKLAIVTWLL